jgi:hypothetical protein
VDLSAASAIIFRTAVRAGAFLVSGNFREGMRRLAIAVSVVGGTFGGFVAFDTAAECRRDIRDQL